MNPSWWRKVWGGRAASPRKPRVRPKVEALEARETPASFDAANLVVLRLGDGSAALSSAATKVFLDEFDTTTANQSSPVQTLSLPTAVSGNNRILTESGSAASEGSLTRSSNGQFLSLVGYDVAAGTASVAGTTINTTTGANQRVVGLVSPDGAIDTSTRITDAYSGNNIRSAVTDDGTRFWTAGPGSPGGLRQVAFGSSGTSTALNGLNTRVVGLYPTVGGTDTQLYVSSGSGSNVGINTVKDTSSTPGLPTGTSTVSLIGSAVNPGNAYAFVFLDVSSSVAGVDTLYVADQTSGLLKYSYDGSAWTARGSISGAITGLAAMVNSSGTVDLYVTTGTTAGNKLLKYTDTAAFNSTINGGTATTLATAGTNTVFRGVAFAPNDAPDIDTAGNFTLTSEAYNDSNPAGNTVKEILNSAGSSGGNPTKITDVNANAKYGMAVTAASGTNGKWQYNTGSGWTDFGSVSESSARLLDAAAKIRFLPDGTATATASKTFTFRAWDQTTGTIGGTADLSATRATGGGSAFSSQTDTASISVTYAAAPAVTNVTSTNDNGVYTVDASITITVKFDQVVTVTGTPRLLLETGDTDHYAVYTSGSGSDTLTFTYGVLEGDTSDDLDYLSTSALVLNGGTIQNSSGVDATLTLPSPGQSGSLGANKNIVIDTTAPAKPTIAAVTADTGPSSSDRYTSDATPTLSGTAEIGASVQVYRDGTAVGSPVTADGSGNWNFTDTSLADATYTYTVVATDLAGNDSVASDDFVVTIDTTSPAKPTIISITDDTGPSPEDGYTNDTTPTLTGTAEPGSLVQVYLDGTAVGSPVTADSSGIWNFTPSALSDGSHSFTAVATDLAGNDSVASDDFVVTIDTTSPTVSSITRAGSNPTKAASVQFTVTFSKAVTGVDAGDFTLTTTGVTGASIASVSGSGTTYTVTVNTGSGSGTIELDLADDDSIIDKAGNALGGPGAGNGDFAGEHYTIDKTAPTVTFDDGDADHLIQVNDTLTYTIQFSEAVTGFDITDLEIASGSTATGTFGNFTAVDADTYTVEFTATGAGTLKVGIKSGVVINDAVNNPLVVPAADDTTVTVNAKPVIGNLSGTVTYTAASTPKVLDSDATVSDPAQADFNGGTLTATITAGAQTGDTLGIAAVGGVTVSGATVSVGGTAVGTFSFSGTTLTVDFNSSAMVASVQSVLRAVTFSNADSNTPDVDRTISFIVTDGDGGTSDTATKTVDVVFTAEVNSIVRAATNPTKASSVSWTVTFSRAVSGVTASNFTLVGSLAGISSIASVTPSSGSSTTFTVTATVGGTGSGGLGLNFTSVSGITPSVTTSTPFVGEAYTIDRTLPSVTVSTLRTNDPTPRITGTVSDNLGVAGVTVLVDGASYTAVVSGNTWYADVTATLSEGPYEVVATATDIVGNDRSDSTTNELTIDLTPPTVSFDDGDADDTVTVGQTLNYTVTFSSDVKPATVVAADFVNTGTAAATVLGVFTTSTPGVFRVVVRANSVGTLILGLRESNGVTDQAGNALTGSITDDTTVTVNPAPVVVSPPPPAGKPPIRSAVAFATGVGMPSAVWVFDGPTGNLRQAFTPFGTGFTGGLSVATGDVTGDGVADLIVGTATGAAAVKVLDGVTGNEVMSFQPFGEGVTAGVTVALGDVNGDGRADVIVGAATQASLVTVFDGATGGMLRAFLAFPGFAGGVRVAAADLDGDGRADVLAGTTEGPGVVRGLSGMTGGELFAFVVDPNSQGVWVAAGDVDGDGRADLITGAGSGAPVVRVFSGTDRRTLAAYPAFDPLVMDGLIPGQRYGWNAGVRVGVVDTDGDGNVEVAAGAGAGLPAGGRIHDPLSGGLLREPLALTPAFLGGIFVGGI